jgi:hypothetical protein
MDGSDGYYLSIQISSTDNTFRYTHRKEEDRNNWKELYKQEIPRFNEMRNKDEKEAITEGLQICEEYVEPLMNFGIFDENERREFDENVTCTKTGYWQSYVASSKAIQGLSKKEGKIFFYHAGMVFLEKDEALAKVHKLLRWRFLGTKDEYDLRDGKLIKKVETQEGKKVSSFSEGAVCPKNGYWEVYLDGEKGSKGVAYFTKGEALSTNSKDPIAILFKWQYLGDENDFEVVGGALVRRV